MKTVGATAAPGSSRPAPAWLAAALLAALAMVAYQHVLHAGFVWDDDAHVTSPGLRTLHGLWRIWSQPGATQQYYPALYSAFWVEHRLWGDAPSWYHAANVALHAGASFLLFLVLRRLAVPGALLGAALFAAHPVCTESVAWISEQKNTLSAVFGLAAVLTYLGYDRDRRPSRYAVALTLFALALLSKSVTATLPAALLVILWWRRGTFSWRTDVLPLAPWFALAAAAGATTAWIERTRVGASGAAFGLSAVDRFLVAGRALWFYIGKLAWPADLTFIYPRWAIDARAPAQYLFPLAAAAALAALWAIRRRTRGPLAAALLFSGTLFPALGFVNVFPFIYSFVADHFQYLAAAAMLPAFAALFALSARHLSGLGSRAAWLAAGCVVALLAGLTRRQCAMYADADTLWQVTIGRNPECWMAYNNLAADLLERGRADEAIEDARKSLRYGPGNAEAYVTLGDAFLQQGRADEALAQYGHALEIEPGNAIAHNNLGNALLQSGHVEEAAAHYLRALEARPDFAKARANLGDAYLRGGRAAEAVTEYRRALDENPLDAGAEANLGTALAQLGRMDEAVTHFRRALDINPSFSIAHTNLGNALLQAGRLDEAVAHYTKALDLDPGSSAAHNNLGYALLRTGRVEEATRQFQRAISIDPQNAAARRNLGDALSRR